MGLIIIVIIITIIILLAKIEGESPSFVRRQELKNEWNFWDNITSRRNKTSTIIDLKFVVGCLPNHSEYSVLLYDNRDINSMYLYQVFRPQRYHLRSVYATINGVQRICLVETNFTPSNFIIHKYGEADFTLSIRAPSYDLMEKKHIMLFNNNQCVFRDVNNRITVRDEGINLGQIGNHNLEE